MEKRVARIVQTKSITQLRNYVQSNPGIQETKGENGRTILQSLVISAPERPVFCSMVKWLLEAGSDAAASDDFGRTAMGNSVILGKLAFFHILFTHCQFQHMSKRDVFGLSLLHYAILLEHTEVVQRIIDWTVDIGLNIDSMTLEGGITPLMLSSNLGSEAICQQLVSGGCSATRRDDTYHLNPEEWAVLGERGFFIHNVRFLPEARTAHSFQLLTGRSNRERRMLSQKTDELLLGLYVRGRSKRLDQASERALADLKTAVAALKGPELYHEVLVSSRSLASVDSPDQSSRSLASVDSPDQHTAQAALTIGDMLRMQTAQRSPAFRPHARRSPSPPPPPDAIPPLGEMGRGDSLASIKRKVSTINALGSGRNRKISTREPPSGSRSPNPCSVKKMSANLAAMRSANGDLIGSIERLESSLNSSAGSRKTSHKLSVPGT